MTWFYEDGRKPTEKEIRERKEKERKELEDSQKILEVPPTLTDEEKSAWEYISNILKGTNRLIKEADIELVYQYTQAKVLRDRAWIEWNKKPEKYIQIITGLCSDGRTAKVTIKENEHYKILNDSNKQIEKILDIFKLSYKARTKR